MKKRVDFWLFVTFTYVGVSTYTYRVYRLYRLYDTNIHYFNCRLLIQSHVDKV